MAKLKDTKGVIDLRILITPLVSLSLAIVMSVPLRLTDSDYPVSIFKLGHCDVCPS
jgi:hypothetical protein